MRQSCTYTIDAANAGKPVADFLRSRGFSRHLLTQMKRTENGITVNGIRVRSSHLLETGDLVAAALPKESASEHIPPVCLPLSIVYEDEDLIVLNKPADMPVHPSIGNYENTLANALAWYYKEQGIPFVFRCINRLDRDTSGLLIVAKHALSGAILSQQMKHRGIQREYLAVVKGVPDTSGTIDAPIARTDDSVIARCVDEAYGEHAVTHYERLAVSPDSRYSLLRIRLETGRTHQIRVHMGYIGHPLPGDFLYCPDYTDYKHQPLHSWRLTFSHPITGEELSFTADVPPEFHPEWFAS